MVRPITDAEKQSWHYTLSMNPIFTYDDMDLAKELISTSPFSLNEKKGVLRPGAHFVLRSSPGLLNMIKLESSWGSGIYSRKLPTGSWRTIRYFTGSSSKDVVELCVYVEGHDAEEPGHDSFRLRVEYIDESGLARIASESFTLDSSWKGLYHVVVGKPFRHASNRRFQA